MRHEIGQATGRLGRLLHRLSQLALLAVVLAALGLAGLAWRLDQGPLTLPWLSREIAAAVNRQIAPMRLEISEASLVWEGFSRGVDRPLDIRATRLAIHDAEGRRVAFVPAMDLSLSLRALLTGQIAARALAVQGARLRAVRRQDGTLALDFVGDSATASDAPGPDRPLLAGVFEVLANPPGTDLGPQATLLSQLRRLQLRDTVVVVHDRALGVVWHVPRLELDVRRGAVGGVEGVATLELVVDGRQLAATAQVSLPSTHHMPGGIEGESPALTVEAQIQTVVPAVFAGITPAFAPLSALQAPVALTAIGRLGPDLVPHAVRLRAVMAAGFLRIGAGTIPVLEGNAEIEATADAVRVTLNRLALPGSHGAAPSVLTGVAVVEPRAGKLAGTFDLRLDQVAFADLATLWPGGMGGEGARAWVTENITGGTAHDLNLRMQVLATRDLSDGEVTSLSGAVEGRDLVVHWLRPVPPVEGVVAHLTFASPDQIDIAVRGGAQAGLTVAGGQVKLSGLAGPEQFATIEVELGGPVVDLLAVLNHPRVNLLSRRPIPMRNPSGRVEGRLVVTALPLISDLKLEEVRLSSSGRLSALNLGGIAAGHDLTEGALSFEAGNDGLAMRGTAALAGIPAQLQVAMDFTEGPPSQVIQTVGVSGNADAAQVAALGLGLPELAMDGVAGLKLDLVERRNGRSELTVRADLAKMALRADLLNWRKPAGSPAVAEALIRLDKDRLAGVERIHVDGDGVTLRAALEASGGAPRRLRLARARLAPATDVQGEILWPQTPGGPWVVRLVGPSLDAAGIMAEIDKAPAVPERRGPPWHVEARLDRAVLGPGRALGSLNLRAQSDGRVVRSAAAAGQAGTGPFEVAIVPVSGARAGRRLTVVAQDAGALLRALDVMDDLRGGRLVLDASYDDTRPDRPLSGSLDVTNFGVRNAPVIGKLLQSMTLYGAIEAMSGPDLQFTRLIAPFSYAGDVISLTDARAFSASLGLTAKGRIDVARRQYDLHGTVVPAYFLNSLLGRVPLLGKLVSPEAGGGLFAMSFAVRGPFADPAVAVNPLSAVTPGFLRGLFGVFEGTPGGGADAPSTPRPLPPTGAMPNGG